MIDSVADRDAIIQQLREELIGPSPHGEPIDFSKPVTFAAKEESYPPRRQMDGEEILQRIAPTTRYGVGVLYPFKTVSDQAEHPIPEGGVESLGDKEIPARVQDEVEQSTLQVAEKLAGGGRDSRG